MKKLLLASLSVASVAMLAGCEKPAPAPAPPPAAATPAPAPAPPPAEAPAPAAAPAAGGEMKKDEKK
jgi:pyruvate dehydrogenase E2 component (dihydrolipoamide acetyltransferase)